MNLNISQKKIVGFTLIELLTSIAVISILASILLVAVRNVRAAAMSASSISNLRQISNGVQLFIASNRGHYPLMRDTRSEAEPVWVEQIAPFLPDDGSRPGRGLNGVFYCPLVEKHAGYGDYGASQYVFLHVPNRNLPDFNPNGLLSVNILEPSNTAMIATAEISGSDPLQGTYWINHRTVRNDTVGSGDRNVPSPRLNAGAVGVLFCDGHVEAIQADRFAKGKAEWFNWVGK